MIRTNKECPIKELDTKLIRSTLNLKGFMVIEDAIDSLLCSELAHDVRRSIELGHSFGKTNSKKSTIGLLNDSDSLLEFLDDPFLFRIVESSFSDKAIVSHVEGHALGDKLESKWLSYHTKILESVQTSAFCPGVILIFALESGGVEIELSVHNPEKYSRSRFLSRITVPQGAVIVIENGTYFRFRSLMTTFIEFSFIRPWIKPRVYLASAILKERLNVLGEQGKKFCGANIGLPSNIEEFIEIEKEALKGDQGRVKGSGI